MWFKPLCLRSSPDPIPLRSVKKTEQTAQQPDQEKSARDEMQNRFTSMKHARSLEGGGSRLPQSLPASKAPWSSMSHVPPEARALHPLGLAKGSPSLTTPHGPFPPGRAHFRTSSFSEVTRHEPALLFILYLFHLQSICLSN